MIRKNILLPVFTLVIGIFLLSSCQHTRSGKLNSDLAPNTIMGGEQDLPFGELKVWITAIEGEMRLSPFRNVNSKIPILAKTQFINVKLTLDAPDGKYSARALLEANMTNPGHYYVTGAREGDKIKLWVQQSGTDLVVSKVNTQELVD